MGVDKKHRRRRPCPCRSPALPGSVSFLLPLCKVPYRGTTLVVFAYRSDNHAAVLRLQNTQPKDRRAYNAPYRNSCMAWARRKDKRQADGQRAQTQARRLCK